MKARNCEGYHGPNLIIRFTVSAFNRTRITKRVRWDGPRRNLEKTLISVSAAVREEYASAKLCSYVVS